MTGFWDVATVADFERAIDAAVAEIGRGSNFDVLSESVDFPVQSQPVSEALAQMTTGFQSRWTGRTALAAKKTLNKLQVERTMGGPAVRAFLTVDEARAWLLSDGPGPATTVPPP